MPSWRPRRTCSSIYRCHPPAKAGNPGMSEEAHTADHPHWLQNLHRQHLSNTLFQRGLSPYGIMRQGRERILDPESRIRSFGGDLVSTWVAKQLQGIPRASDLVNTTGNT